MSSTDMIVRGTISSAVERAVTGQPGTAVLREGKPTFARGTLARQR
jgi:hypothetical protein